MGVGVEDFKYTIVIPGCPRTKKNGITFSMFRFDQKTKRKILRPKPITILKKPYMEWTKIATQTLVVWKSKQNGTSFPLMHKMNMKCLFYMDPKISVVDLSALYEGIQDVMQGKGYAGVPAQYYQIIADDNSRIIGSHDGSRVLVDAVNPRMEITLTPFKYKYEV